MPQRGETNGSIHGMSLLVGELKGEVRVLTSTVASMVAQWREQDTRAEQKRDQLHSAFEELRDEVQQVKGTAAAVQQDVAEMKNDQETVKVTLATFQMKEQRVLGWWDAARWGGKIAYVLIGATATGGFAIFYTYILPHWM